MEQTQLYKFLADAKIQQCERQIAQDRANAIECEAKALRQLQRMIENRLAEREHEHKHTLAIGLGQLRRDFEMGKPVEPEDIIPQSGQGQRAPIVFDQQAMLAGLQHPHFPKPKTPTAAGVAPGLLFGEVTANPQSNTAEQPAGPTASPSHNYGYAHGHAHNLAPFQPSPTLTVSSSPHHSDEALAYSNPAQIHPTSQLVQQLTPSDVLHIKGKGKQRDSVDGNGERWQPTQASSNTVAPEEVRSDYTFKDSGMGSNGEEMPVVPKVPDLPPAPLYCDCAVPMWVETCLGCFKMIPLQPGEVGAGGFQGGGSVATAGG